MKRTVLILVGVFVVGMLCLGLAIQIVPYGRDHTNPPVLAEPVWDSQATRDIAARACFDCHSNETRWPWYSNVAPVSWLVYRDVQKGREELNFSQWGQGEQEVDEIVEVVQEGEMPLPIYLPTHPEARLSADEKQALIQGFQNTFGLSQKAKEKDRD
jgi:hypothetical protein